MMNLIAIFIAALSLVISGISLYFALRKDRFEKRIITAQKKSDILKHISDSKSKFERCLNKIKIMNKVWETCESCPTDRLKRIEKSVVESIQNHDHFYNKISSITEEADPVVLEGLIPRFYDMARKAEDGFLETSDLIEGCNACQEKIKKTNSL